ncbi:MAG TPA: GvpL/GvpF family gas vesicle protein [Pyrinomonadaceae bacterium]|nr:GvpL/GvpF family gas vesicle protein [Pyrinomonadaceae bacterium]
MKLYVYCLVEGVAHLDQLPQGISNAPVRILAIDNLAVLVSDVDSDTVPVTRENALVHAAVVRSVLDRTTPLPFRFGTLVAEQQLRSYVTARKPALEKNLALVRDCVEMSVKIIWNTSNNDEHEEQLSDEKQGVGARFLEQKRRELLGSEQRSAEAAQISGWLHESISSLIRDEHIAVRPSEKLVLAAAHLVERDKMKEYREKIAETRSERPDLHFLLSGPWPPYSFANIELEFETPFGVSW